VARLAGLPDAAIARASEVLARLEKGKSYKSPALSDLPLFQAPVEAQKQAAPSPALKHLRAIRPDDLSPREALDALYQLKDMLSDESP
jgi:DNA mismatch repair protein MutS